MMLILAAITVILLWGLAPVTAYAADVNSLAETIQNYDSNLTATVDAENNTVTVTETVTDKNLTLDIDSGVTVVWKAKAYITEGTSNTLPLIILPGAGVFEVAEGGAAIHAYGNGSTVKVTDGTVSSEEGSAINIESSSTVTVSGTGEVRSETGSFTINSNEQVFCGVLI